MSAIPAHPSTTASDRRARRRPRQASVTILRAIGSVSRSSTGISQAWMPQAEPVHAIAFRQIRGPAGGARQRGHDAEAATEVTRGVHGGLGDSDHRAAGEFAGRVQAGVAEAGDDIPVDARLFTAADHARADRAHSSPRRSGSRSTAGRTSEVTASTSVLRPGDRLRAPADGRGHRLRGVRVDDPDRVTTPILPTSDVARRPTGSRRRSRRRSR